MVWNDAYQNDHQFITGSDHIILFERYKYSELVEMEGLKIHVTRWHKWKKACEKELLSKAWFVKVLTMEDAITDNYEKTKE